VLFWVFIIIGSCSVVGQQEEAFSIEGRWIGLLQSIRVVFNIENVNDSIIATLDSPDQGAEGILVNRVSFEKGSLIIEVEVINGKYVGNYDHHREIFEGTWFQNSMEFPLNIAKDDGSFDVKRPQEPKPPFPYVSEDVSFTNQEAGVTLAGTLTLPENGDSFPAVILITGSGLQNRDEEIVGHKPFLVISDYLTRQGIAVLRYDDRGFGESTGDVFTGTTADFADDAAAGVKFLSIDPRINKEKIGIIGHSEGAMIATILASESENIAFIVMLAGPGMAGKELLRLQAEKIMRASGENREFIEEVIELNEKLYDIVITETDDEKAEKKMRKAYAKFTKGMSEDEKNRFGFSDYVIDTGIKELLNPWMRYFLTLDTKTYLRQVKCSVLVMNGEKDLQVPPGENVPLIETALAEGGNQNVSVMVFTNLNHLFQSATTGSPEEYSKIEETFSPEVLEIMGIWIKEQVE